MMPASRLSKLAYSPIRAMFDGAPPGCLSLGLGEPGWPPHPALASGLAEAAESAGCAYGPNAGLPELQAAVASVESSSPDRLMLSAGSQAALYSLFQAWLNPGDPVLVPDPGFLAYPVLARLAGARPVGYSLGVDGSLCSRRVESVMNACTRRTVRMVVINHPANPTGGGASQEELERLVSICQARGVLLVSDEVYRHLYLEGPHPGLRSVSQAGVVVASLSKAWAAPGLRVGWAEADPALLAPTRLLHNYINTAAARPSQQAAIGLLRASDSVLPQARAALAERWSLVAKGLREGLGLRPLPPAGGFYYWLRLPRGGQASSLDLCRELRDQAGLILIPGTAFGRHGEGYARLSFGGGCAELQEAVARLCGHWRRAGWLLP